MRVSPATRACDRHILSPAFPGHYPLSTALSKSGPGCIPNHCLSSEAKQFSRLNSPLVNQASTIIWDAPSGPAVPCKSLRNVLYCKVEPEHIRAAPERAACAQLPAYLTQASNHVNSALNRTSEPLPKAHIAPGSAGNDSKCAELPSAAPPTHSVMTRAMQPMPAPAGTRFCILSRRSTQLSLFCALSALKTTSFARFHDKNDREPTAAVSCYESPCPISCHEKTEKFFKVRPNRPKQAVRYPIDTLSIPDFPEIRSHFTNTIRRSWVNSGQIRPHT